MYHVSVTYQAIDILTTAFTRIEESPVKFRVPRFEQWRSRDPVEVIVCAIGHLMRSLRHSYYDPKTSDCGVVMAPEGAITEGTREGL